MEQREQAEWIEALRESPFAKPHFTEQLRSSVIQQTHTRQRQRVPVMAVSAAAMVLLLIAALLAVNGDWLNPRPEPAATQAADGWEPTGFFYVNGIEMLGHEGKFGIRKMNRTEDSEFFISKAGYLITVYFWGVQKLLTGEYQFTATKQGSDQAITLYEWPVQLGGSEVGADAQSGAKFAIDEPGLWRLDVSINGVPFDHVIVDVKEAWPDIQVQTSNPAGVSEEDALQLVELTKRHFQFANQSDFVQYAGTMFPAPSKVEDGTPLNTVWKDARVKPVQLISMSFVSQDNSDKPRVIADVQWTDRQMQIAYKKYNDGWKIVSLD